MRISIVVEVHAQKILARCIMAIFKRIVCNGDKFALCIRGSTRFCKPFYGRGPKNIRFALARTLNHGLVFLISSKWNAGSKFTVGLDGSKIIFAAHLGMLRLMDQIEEQFLLYFNRIF